MYIASATAFERGVVEQSSFVDRVRNGKLKAPTQPGFSLSRWTGSYSSVESPSILEQRLHHSGVWFAQRLGRVRDLLAEYDYIEIPGNRTVRAHVGAANWIIRNDAQLHQEQIDASLQRGAGEDGVGVFSAGAEPVMRFHSMIEGVVTSLRFAFADAVRESRRPAEGDISEGVEAITKIRIRIQAGMIYDLLYYLWNECLWNDWYVDTSGEADIVAPSNMELAITRAVGERRWAELGTELFVGLGMDWRRRRTTEKERLVSMPRVVGLEEEAGRWRIVIGPGDATSPHAPIELVTQLASTELYFGELLSEELPNFPRLRIKDLVSAWASLAPLADMVSDRFPEHGYIDTLEQVIDYCPTFEASQLKGVLTAAMPITGDQAEQILDLLTFSDVREDLWLRPFVRIDAETVAIVVSALKSPNLLRSIEQWMKVGGFDLDRRGGAFERFVRERLAQGNKLSNFEIVRRPFKLEVGGIEEEIDLVARVGSTLIVGEVKCSILPTEPMEVYRYFDDRLRTGAAQAARKARFARANFDAFISQAGFTEVGEEADVIPLVLTNLALGVGMSFDEVPVVDLLILRRFIDEGAVGHNGYLNQDGEMVVESEERLYASEAEAATALKEYLRNPPQLRQYIAQLDAVPMPIASVSDDEKPVYFIESISARPETPSAGRRPADRGA